MTAFNNMGQMQAPDYSGYLLGRVVENNDPEKRQRVKVTIPRLLPEGAELPWIAPIHPIGSGMHDDVGMVSVPDIGSYVVVEFQNSDLSYGIFHGVMPSKTFTPDPALLVNYPKRRGNRDAAGNLWWLDTTEGAVEFHFQMPSGFSFHVDNTGKLTLNAPGGIEITAPTTHITSETTHVGDVRIEGNTHTTLNSFIGGSATIQNDATIGGKSFLGHRHTAQGAFAITTPPN